MISHLLSYLFNKSEITGIFSVSTIMFKNGKANDLVTMVKYFTALTISIY